MFFRAEMSFCQRAATCQVRKPLSLGRDWFWKVTFLLRRVVPRVGWLQRYAGYLGTLNDAYCRYIRCIWLMQYLGRIHPYPPLPIELVVASFRGSKKDWSINGPMMALPRFVPAPALLFSCPWTVPGWGPQQPQQPKHMGNVGRQGGLVMLNWLTTRATNG